MMKAADIPVSVAHQRSDRFSVFGGLRRDLENQIRFNEYQIAIPVHAGLTDGDIEQVLGAAKAGW